MANYEPYSQNKAQLTLNSEDNIYLDQGGEYSLLNLVQLGSSYSSGFLGSVTLGVEANDTSSTTASSTSTSHSTGISTTTTGTGAVAATSSSWTVKMETSSGIISIFLAGLFGYVLI